MYREVRFKWMAYLRTEGNFRLPPEPETEGGEGYGTCVHPVAKVDEKTTVSCNNKALPHVGVMGAKIVQSVKTIGSNGQISLGKEYAGRLVIVDEVEPGVWVIKMGEFVPDSERWLLNPDVKRNIEEAVEWAKHNSPTESNLDDLERRITDGR